MKRKKIGESKKMRENWKERREDEGEGREERELKEKEKR